MPLGRKTKNRGKLTPGNLQEMAASLVLATPQLKIPALLILAREVSNGRKPSEVVQNLPDQVKSWLTVPPQRQAAEQVFTLLKENEHKNRQRIDEIKECKSCGEKVLFSGSDSCQACGNKIHWTDANRMLMCIDSLLWLFEQRVEVSSTDEFSNFVELLVELANELLRKSQEVSASDKRLLLDRLKKVSRLFDKNKGGAVDTGNPTQLKIYLIKDNMLEDSESFTTFLYKEVEHLVSMIS